MSATDKDALLTMERSADIGILLWWKREGSGLYTSGRTQRNKHSTPDTRMPDPDRRSVPPSDSANESVRSGNASQISPRRYRRRSHCPPVIAVLDDDPAARHEIRATATSELVATGRTQTRTNTTHKFDPSKLTQQMPMAITAAQKTAIEDILSILVAATPSRGKRQLAGMFLDLVDRTDWPEYYEVTRPLPLPSSPHPSV